MPLLPHGLLLVCGLLAAGAALGSLLWQPAPVPTRSTDFAHLSAPRQSGPPSWDQLEGDASGPADAERDPLADASDDGGDSDGGWLEAVGPHPVNMSNVVVGLMTCDRFLPTRGAALRDTWLSRARRVLYFSDDAFASDGGRGHFLQGSLLPFSDTRETSARRTSARASCLRSAAGEARLRADAAGRNCARTHLFRRQLARCPHPTLCGGGILHGRRGGAASRTRRAGGGVGVPRGRRLVRDHVAVDGNAFSVPRVEGALSGTRARLCE